MVRVLFRLLIKDRCRLKLLGEFRVVEIHGHVERQRVKDPGFRVVGVMFAEPLHSLLVSLGARPICCVVVTLEEGSDRGEVFGFARALRLRGLTLLDGFLRGLDYGRRERRHQRVRHRAHRQPPIGDRAVRIVLDDCLERLDRLGVVEIVQQRDRPLELGLHRGA